MDERKRPPSPSSRVSMKHPGGELSKGCTMPALPVKQRSDWPLKKRRGTLGVMTALESVEEGGGGRRRDDRAEGLLKFFAPKVSGMERESIRLAQIQYQSSCSSASSFSSLFSQEAAPNKNRKPNKLLMLSDAIDFVQREDQNQQKRERRLMDARNNKVVRKLKREDDNQKPPPDSPPAWVVRKFRDMGATDEHLNIVCKSVTKSDIDKSQNRLLLSKYDVERSNLLKHFKHLKKKIESDGVEVEVLDGQMRRYIMVFKYLGSNKDYRIIRPDWIVFVRKNCLNCTGDRVHVCMFYVPVAGGEEQRLRLGIVREPGQEAHPVHREDDVR